MIRPADYGFLDFGVAEASPVDPHFFDSYLSTGYSATMEYLKRNVEKRLNPALLVEGARSVLCFLAPYGNAERGFAGFACGADYHKVVKERLFMVMRDLKDEFPEFDGRAFVDSAPVLERYWASKSGLGFIGCNGFLISPEWGLRTIIGIIICNLETSVFPHHQPLEQNSCGDCGKCRKACPTGALKDNGIVDSRLCISFNTIESKEIGIAHPVDYHGWVFGCEECLKACPWNRELEGWSEFDSHREQIRQADWSSITGEEFQNEFADSGLMRAGIAKIRDNAYGVQE